METSSNNIYTFNADVYEFYGMSLYDCVEAYLDTHPEAMIDEEKIEASVDDWLDDNTETVNTLINEDVVAWLDENETVVQGYVAEAEGYASDASNSADAASDSADTASDKALVAEGYADGKQNGTDVSSGSPYYHNNAKYYSEEASAAKDAAETAQDNAETARDAASDYATAAGTSATTASVKASEASSSASNAASSASTASTKASEASASATSASGAATAASASASAASGSATAASGSATAASGSAATASTKALVSEGFAVGEQGGVPVESGSDYYENNAKYYSEQAAASAEEAEETLSSYAKIDGFYEDMGAGYADQLASDTFESDSVPYLYRTTGGSTEVGDRCYNDSIVGASVAWNQLVANSGSVSVTVPSGHKYYSNIGGTKAIAISNGSAISATGGTDNIVDLTALFGSSEIADYIYSLETATAGAGVAWLRNHGFIDGAYHEYDSGSLKSVEGLVSHDTVGFNQWDEEWENGYLGNRGDFIADANSICFKNYLEVIPSVIYYGKCPSDKSLRICSYDSDKNFISLQSVGNAVFTLPSGAKFIRCSVSNYGTTYNHDICINLSWDGSRNGEYEPYRKHSYPLDDSLTLRGIYKLDASNRLYADGDEYAPDGTVTRKYGIVDLGTLDWAYNKDPSYVRFYSTNLNSVIAKPSDGHQKGNIICAKYENIPTEGGIFTNNGDKVIGIGTAGTISIRDLAYSDAPTFKTSLSGVYLIYEKAESSTESADPYQQVQIVDDFGTEEFVIDSGSFPVPVGHQTRYMANLKAKLEMAPNSPSGDGDYIVRHANGTNSYVPLVIEEALPTIPATDGDYRLKVTVANGESTLSWEAEA